MTRFVLISIVIGMVFAGLEGAADAAGTISADNANHGHEVHGLVHADDHQHKHDGDSYQDDHFCHCSVHAVALVAVTVASVPEKQAIAASRYDDHFSSEAGPPLLRPPNC